MFNDPRFFGAFPRAVRPASAQRSTSGLEHADDSTLVELIAAGSVPAFAALFDRTIAAVRAELPPGLPGSARRREIMAASYVEVWWLAGCHRPAPLDVRGWICGIVRRRVADAARAPSRPGAPTTAPGPRPSYAELELAALLRRPVDGLLPE